MHIENPFHDGELEAQRRTGESAEGARNGEMIMDRIHPGGAKLIERQQLLVLATIDKQSLPWASVVLGQPGFMNASALDEMIVDLSAAHVAVGDQLLNRVENDDRVGALIIALASRLRIRVNGNANIDDQQLRIRVAESYPNCPKYIQRRRISFSDDSTIASASTSSGINLEDEQLRIIRDADTFFIATMHPDRGADASHRGGMPGFVEVVDDRTLSVPDYVGNSIYNTLGNLIVNPAAGLVFLDFETGATLQLTGKAEIDWEGEDTDGPTGGTKRFWTFTVDEWVQSAMPVKMDSELIDYSPFNPGNE